MLQESSYNMPQRYGIKTFKTIKVFRFSLVSDLLVCFAIIGRSVADYCLVLRSTCAELPVSG